MRPRLRVLAVLAALVLATIGVPPAVAAPSLTAPVEGAVLLGFGAPYGSRVHSGLDIAASGGAGVAAAAAGSVTFAGRLPIDGADVLCVTVTTPEGFKVTCLPLESVSVEKGDVVTSGQALGVLAPQGDASSVDPHLHLSVREGESYLDPAKLMPAPPAPPEPVPVPEPAPASPAAEVPLPAPSAPPAPALANGVPAGSPAPAGSAPAAATPPLADPAPGPASAPSAGPARSVAPAPSTGLTAPSAGVSPAGASAAEPGHVAASRLAAPAAGASALGPALASVSRAFARRHEPAPARPARPVAPTAFATLSAGYSRLSSLATLLAALMVSAALLWPAWRRISALAPAAEPVPVRIRA